jgi:ATP-dependent Clp protease protease subunit
MTPKDYQGFGLYAKDHGVSSLDLHRYNQRVENSLTPYILEERQMNVTIMDVFSRLMMERSIWVAGEVKEQKSTIVHAQIMFLDS